MKSNSSCLQELLDAVVGKDDIGTYLDNVTNADFIAAVSELKAQQISEVLERDGAWREPSKWHNMLDKTLAKTPAGTHFLPVFVAAVLEDATMCAKGHARFFGSGVWCIANGPRLSSQELMTRQNEFDWHIKLFSDCNEGVIEVQWPSKDGVPLSYAGNYRE